MDYGERYRAKRAAGISEWRSDGSLTSCETDVQAGAAEEFAVMQLGAQPNREIYAMRGDGGHDCMLGDLTVDVVHLGLIKGTASPRMTGNLIVNRHEPHRHCDIYVVVRGVIASGFELLGWYPHVELIERPPSDFGYGLRYCVPIEELRPIGELLAAINWQKDNA